MHKWRCLAAGMKITKAIQILDHALKNGYEYLHTEDGDMAVRSAIEALSRQVPKKPDEVFFENGDQSQTIDICPTCGSTEISEADEWQYCPVCGQKIDWGEENQNE